MYVYTTDTIAIIKVIDIANISHCVLVSFGCLVCFFAFVVGTCNTRCTLLNQFEVLQSIVPLVEQTVHLDSLILNLFYSFLTFFVSLSHISSLKIIAVICEGNI